MLGTNGVMIISNGISEFVFVRNGIDWTYCKPLPTGTTGFTVGSVTESSVCISYTVKSVTEEFETTEEYLLTA